MIPRSKCRPLNRSSALILTIIAVGSHRFQSLHQNPSKYLNNVVEQDHRRIKQRIRPMLGFKRFETAAITIGGIELAEKIRKHQFKTGNLPGQPATAPDIWAAILAA